jgi:acyl-CoA synthetase (NDP forming)
VEERTVEQIIARAATSGRSAALSDVESKQLLQALGVAVAIPQAARSAEEAAAAAAAIGFPVVLKVLSPAVTHKSEVGGVVLGLDSENAVRSAFSRIRDSLAAHTPTAPFEGVAVDRMARPGVELILGITRDERFGPLVIVGLGGIFVEVLADTAFRLAPIDNAQARGMLEELRGGAILRGVRGAPPIDFDAVAALLVKLSEFAASHPEVKEMDLNPVVAYDDGFAVLDARVLVAAPAATGGRAADPHYTARLENLKRALNAETVAVIGDKRVGGYMWLRAMKRLSGKLYSVQIDPNEIPGIEAMGVTNYRSLAEIPEPRIDYAVSAVPRQVAPRILKDCIANRVGSIGFFTSGFSETTEELGLRLEGELRDLATASEIALVGPNCMGLYSPAVGLCNFPDLKTGEGGNVCFISQSGTHTINFSTQAPIRGIKVNYAASIGNVLMLEAADFLGLMADHPATRVIGMYVEGVRDGRRFFETLQRATARHPVVIWKGGMTAAGARATFSHTGSLATPAAVWDAMVRQAGAVSAFGLDAMLDAVEMLARGRAVTGPRMGLVAMTGGQSVVITDTFAGAELDIPTLSDSSYEELKSFFNIIGGSYRNPLDAGGTIGGGVHTGNLQRILEILDRDRVIDAIVLEIGTGFAAQRWATHEDELTSLLDKIADFNERTAKPFVAIMHQAHVAQIVGHARELARARGLVVFDSFERAAAALRVSYDYWSMRTARDGAKPPSRGA